MLDYDCAISAITASVSSSPSRRPCRAALYTFDFALLALDEDGLVPLRVSFSQTANAASFGAQLEVFH